MTKFFTLILVTVVCFESVFSQESKLFVVDSVPLNVDRVSRDIKIVTDDIHEFRIISDKDEIYRQGYKNLDSLIYITTKAYAQRSDELKKIPTSNLMVLRNTIWYYRNKPYTGAFIDYYVNGKKESEGNMIKGKVEGIRTYFYENGTVSNKYMFKNSQLEGQQYSYHQNGNVKSEYFCIENIPSGQIKKYHENGRLYQEYYLKNSLIDGYIDEYYSTGKLKRKYRNDFPYYLDPKEREIRLFFTDSEESYYKFGSEDPINRAGLKDSKEILKFLKHTNKLISKDQNIDSYYVHRAILNYVQTDYDASISDLRKALELEPNSKIVPYYLSIILIAKYEVENLELIPGKIRNEICDGLLFQSPYETFYKDISVEKFHDQYCKNH